MQSSDKPLPPLTPQDTDYWDLMRQVKAKRTLEKFIERNKVPAPPPEPVPFPVSAGATVPPPVPPPAPEPVPWTADEIGVFLTQGRISEWEAGFLRDVRRFRKLSPKQLAVVEKIRSKVN